MVSAVWRASWIASGDGLAGVGSTVGFTVRTRGDLPFVIAVASIVERNATLGSVVFVFMFGLGSELLVLLGDLGSKVFEFDRHGRRVGQQLGSGCGGDETRW